MKLTIERLFESPALTGPPISAIKISPDGSAIAYLRGRGDDKDRLDLWEFDCAARRSRMLVDSSRLEPQDACLSEAERSRRERQRIAALRGIVDYSWAPGGRAILVPLAGRLYNIEIKDGKVAHATEISPSAIAAIDPKFSPCGGFVAFVRDQNLHVHDLGRGTTTALTSDGGGLIKNGMAEFAAQEEMGRHTGYWWSPDSSHIAFARVDESAVAVHRRFEISADDVVTVEQRYPAAGGCNVAIRVGVVRVADGRISWMDLGGETDVYLARVDWLPDGRTLAIQRQSRDQRRLDLLFSHIESGSSRVALTDTSDTWIELHDELTFLAASREFIWASSRDGYRHLYLYDLEGRIRRQLTAGTWSVAEFGARAVKAVDETRRLVYFIATEKGVTERHLYRTSLDSGDPRRVERISAEDGLHSITFSADAAFYADHFTSSAQPPRLRLHGADGAVKASIVDNRLDHDHPYIRYLSDDSSPDFGALTAADGQALHYRLLKPGGFDPGKRYPAVVDVYGGPGVQRVLDQWTGGSFAQILTRAGYVVFQLDNRGSAHRGVRFRTPIKGCLGEIEAADQLQGAQFLAAQPFIDPARIGVWGWSYGGYLTLMLMFKAPGIFRAGVSGAPVADWSLYDTHYTERYLDRPTDNAAGYAASSVLPYASGLSGRLLVMHGMADDNVHFSHSTKLFRRLQVLGKQFGIMVYPGAKHALLRQKEGRHAYATILGFFDEHLR